MSEFEARQISKGNGLFDKQTNIRTELKKELKRDVKNLMRQQHKVLSGILTELKQENSRQEKQEKVLDAILTCFSCSPNGRCKNTDQKMSCECTPGFIGDGTTCVEDTFTPTGYLGGMSPYNSSWYFISPETKSWKDARTVCQHHGADLASPETPGEWRHLYDAVGQRDGNNFHWLGAKGDGKLGGYGWWMDGTRLSRVHSSWRDGKPEYLGISCLLMQDVETFGIENSWRDYRCSAKFRFICELKLSEKTV